MSNVAKKILELSLDKIFKVKKVEAELPDRARIYPSLECSECGDMASKNRCRVKDGKMVCIPCFETY